MDISKQGNYARLLNRIARPHTPTFPMNQKKKTPRTQVSRRAFIRTSAHVAAGSVLAASTVAALHGENVKAVHQATGVKVGEVTETSAIVWTRLTASPVRLNPLGQHVFDR